MSWFEPVQHGQASAGNAASTDATTPRSSSAAKRRVRQHEGEGEVELVPVAEVPGPLLDVERVRLAEEESRWVIGLREPAPLPKDPVRLRSEHRVATAHAESGDHRLVPQVPDP